MDEEKIKEAFTRVREDIFSLGNELSQLKIELTEIKNRLKLLSSFIENAKIHEITAPAHPTHHQKTPTIPTHNPTQKLIPTDNLPLYSLKTQNMQVSIGNQGVPTNKQTNQQTNQHIILSEKQPANSLEKASEILASLDVLKKEARLKFKRLTAQEMQVFSALYTLEDQGELVDYKALSLKLNLSESSIRDYIGKIQRKGIPIAKEKLNNKRVLLHISQDLKKIASLNTILQLREL